MINLFWKAFLIALVVSILRHHAQGFQRSLLIKEYMDEENQFMETVSVIHK